MSRTRSFAYSLAIGFAAIFLGCMWVMMFVAYGGSTSFEAIAVLGLFGLAVVWVGFSALRRVAYAFRPEKEKTALSDTMPKATSPPARPENPSK